MNKNWERTSLGKLQAQNRANVQTGPFGTVLKASEYCSHGVPVISVSEIRCGFIDITDRTPNVSEETTARLPQFVLKEGDIVFGRKGAIDRNSIIQNSQSGWFLGSDGIRLRLSEGINSVFVSYQLRSTAVGKWLLQNSSGSIMPSLNQKVLDRMPLWLPEIAEQQKIAAVLSALDAKIDCNNSINAELEAMAKTLYDYWFVQFDFPFDFAQGRPDANGKPYKSSGGKMVYNRTLKRKIPAGWEVKEIGSVVKTTLGGTPATSNNEYWEDADIPWLSSAEIANFPVITSEQRITRKGIDNSAAVTLPKGSVVVSIVRYIRPSILGIDAATNQSVVGILENNQLKSSFLYPFLCGEVPRLMGLRTGAQQPHINKGTIDETLVAIPSQDVLARYYKAANPIYAAIMTRAFETQQLIQLRDWLLPMLMNGQVRVA